MRRYCQATLIGFALFSGSSLSAQSVALTEDLPETRFPLNGQTFVIGRDRARAEAFAASPVPEWVCPPDCIQPMVASPGVETIGELETIRFLETMVSEGNGLLIDSRLPERFQAGSIPGAVNVPAMTLSEDNPYLRDILLALGAQDQGGGALGFAGALDIAVFCDGPSSGEAVLTIEKLLAAGYPAGKLHFYRGGMHSWQSLGLSVSVSENEG